MCKHRKREGNKQITLCCWCAVNSCPLLKPHSQLSVCPFPILFFSGAGRVSECNDAEGGCDSFAAVPDEHMQADCITAKIPAAGKLLSPGRGQDMCSSQTKHMIQFVCVAGHTKATASKHMALKACHTYNILFLKANLALTMATMLLRFLSVG